MTYYLVLASALVVAAAGSMVRRRSYFWGNGLIILGCLGCAACIVWQLRQTILPPQARGPDRGQAVVAYFLANRVLGDIDRQGTVVLLFPPESVFDEETVGTYAGTFSRVLRSVPGLEVKLLTLAVPSKAAKKGEISVEAFQQAISNAAPAVAYVSFAGIPEEIGKLLGQRVGGPGFYAFDPWGKTNWLAALKSGLVRAVIVPRPGVDHAAGGEISGEPGEVFRQLYLMAVPATAEQIAAQLGTR